MTNAKPRRASFLAACLCLLAWAGAAVAQAPVKTVAWFTKGDIRFTQGGATYSAGLVNGRIDVVEELAGEAPLEIRTLHLQFALLAGDAGAPPDATPDVRIVLKNADGPRAYDSSDLLVFTVQTSTGGAWAFQVGRGTCTVTLTRLARSGVAGTASCEEPPPGAVGGTGPSVTHAAFTAAP